MPITGGEQLLESYHADVNSDGRVVAEFTGRKLRTNPASLGYSTAPTITNASEVGELGRQILATLDFRGVAKLASSETLAVGCGSWR